MIQQTFAVKGEAKPAMQTIVYIGQGHLRLVEIQMHELDCFRAAADYGLMASHFSFYPAFFQMPKAQILIMWKGTLDYLKYLDLFLITPKKILYKRL